jgi:hypothetical protein
VPNQVLKIQALIIGFDPHKFDVERNERQRHESLPDVPGKIGNNVPLKLRHTASDTCPGPRKDDTSFLDDFYRRQRED